ncbi:MAG TPA: hypothetical protein VLC92_16905 [Rhodocyclaceae bacterium]|nr:hypothetical protein [Rhodocyclaceae bacterium]
MNPSPVFLPAEAVAALQRGDKIEAVKILRASTDIGLYEAKDAIEQFEVGQLTALPISLPAEAVAALQRGSKIDAIRLLRAATGLGLREAMDAVEQFESGEPIALQFPRTPMAVSEEVASALKRGTKLEAIRLLQTQTGLSLKEAKEAVEAHIEGAHPMTVLASGEVGQSRGSMRWFIACIVAFEIAGYLLSKIV